MDGLIDKKEVLRYLGYKGQQIDSNTENTINACIKKIVEISKPKYTYKIFGITHDENNIRIFLDNSNLILTGKNIYKHLKNSNKCALMAATLGVSVDNAIRIAQSSNMTEAVILDACATEYIEKICDKAEEEVKSIALSEGMGTNFRFSPGYGDLPIDIQPKLLDVLDTVRKIGLTVTERDIMIPRKSVTAIIGFTNKKSENPKCEICSMKDTCQFKERGADCGR